ncbi:uncharacterized protein LOC135095103 isoform X4 [Scylla paramamosain]|uniref:uncharacterized protein LOC135095103 isoform X4 n=1 Tax=Scylla paramamosain TaxID=85552 RepID=UPI003083B0A5
MSLPLTQPFHHLPCEGAVCTEARPTLQIVMLSVTGNSGVLASSAHTLQLETLAQEAQHLQMASLQDSEQLLKDTSQQPSLLYVLNSADLQRQLETLSEENVQLSGLWMRTRCSGGICTT